jgi:hypothetical protein
MTITAPHLRAERRSAAARTYGLDGLASFTIITPNPNPVP